MFADFIDLRVNSWGVAGWRLLLHWLVVVRVYYVTLRAAPRFTLGGRKPTDDRIPAACREVSGRFKIEGSQRPVQGGGLLAVVENRPRRFSKGLVGVGVRLPASKRLWAAVPPKSDFEEPSAGASAPALATGHFEAGPASVTGRGRGSVRTLARLRSVQAAGVACKRER